MTIVYRGPDAFDLAAKEEVLPLRSSKRERKVDNRKPEFHHKASAFHSGPRFEYRPFEGKL